MDRLLVPQDLCVDSTPSPQETTLQYTLKRTETTAFSHTVIDGVPLGDLRHHYPCQAVEHWVRSGRGSPTSMMPCQNPWAMETSAFTLPSSHSSTPSMPDGLPRFFLSCDSDWPSSSMTSGPTPGQLRPGLSRTDDSRTCSEWMRESGKDVSYASKPDRYTAPPEAFGPYQRPSGILTTTYPIAALTPPSPAFSASSCQMSSPVLKSEPVRVDTRATPANAEEDASIDPPYSTLIYKALRGAPGKKLSLQEIYGWFEENTTKGKDRSSKGWQNSIRHNLSMNAGFEAVRVEKAPGKKALNYWRLTDEAITHGIQSTTRYRKQANYKKTVGSDPPAPQRQRSGAKGGKATKITAKFRRFMNQDEPRKERYYQRLVSQRRAHKIPHSQHHPSPVTAAVVSRFHASGPATPLTRTSAEPFDLGSIVGNADPPSCTAIFCDMAGPGSDCLAMETGFLGWSSLPPFPHGLLTGPDISAEVQLAV
ncbi:forkhead domain protein [Aspergillus bombycis]|uniref:Forkhead domain protein n=1 Tax=Aspergillus bombycis TaxID=109264 RepID=A0A1F7ZSG4_9EURO|nr:forkhead domain protein [Aspergillus bombycis]OGM42209.1 forkhead domain protein [Aspergillus bombycis]